MWRILNFDYAKNTASNYDMDGTKVFQPELNGFYLFELLAGEKRASYSYNIHVAICVYIQVARCCSE